MKVGDLVRVQDGSSVAMNWVGLIIGFARGYVEVYWNEDYPYEIEYPEQLELA